MEIKEGLSVEKLCKGSSSALASYAACDCKMSHVQHCTWEAQLRQDISFSTRAQMLQPRVPGFQGLILQVPGLRGSA